MSENCIPRAGVGVAFCWTYAMMTLGDDMMLISEFNFFFHSHIKGNILFLKSINSESDLSASAWITLDSYHSHNGTSSKNEIFPLPLVLFHLYFVLLLFFFLFPFFLILVHVMYEYIVVLNIKGGPLERT